jgi:hypothetical protein
MMRAGHARAPSYDAGEPVHAGGGYVLVPPRCLRRSAIVRSRSWQQRPRQSPTGGLRRYEADVVIHKPSCRELGMTGAATRDLARRAVHTVYRRGVWVNENGGRRGALTRSSTRAGTARRTRVREPAADRLRRAPHGRQHPQLVAFEDERAARGWIAMSLSRRQGGRSGKAGVCVQRLARAPVAAGAGAQDGLHGIATTRQHDGNRRRSAAT